MSGYIYWSAVCAVVALMSHLWTMRQVRAAESKAEAIDRHLLDVARKAREASDRAIRYEAIALRAVALLRDDAHRSRQAKDGTRRYDAWRADRDALIREVEG